jgi:8-oxo-dGTP pyrophosphatase MutT (NUDIX family)
MNRHAGQWALPGGKVDAGETPEAAALREMEEELGLSLEPSHVLGRLDDYATRSGFVITPVVVWGGDDVELTPDPREVAHVLRIGLHELCRQDSPRFVSIPESDRPVVQLPIGRDLIHAPTGAVLLQFRWVAIEGRADARVNEFEQPVFAWS